MIPLSVCVCGKTDTLPAVAAGLLPRRRGENDKEACMMKELFLGVRGIVRRLNDWRRFRGQGMEKIVAWELTQEIRARVPNRMAVPP